MYILFYESVKTTLTLQPPKVHKNDAQYLFDFKTTLLVSILLSYDPYQ